MSEAEFEQKALLDFEEDRYASLKLIDWFELNRVMNARVLVIGAGAIGNEVLKNLALLGVGNIFIYDRDTIEMSNLTRSVLFRASDRDKLKSETAARAVKEINPNVNAHWFEGDIRFDLGLGLIRRMDVVIGCLDNREARLKINKDCFRIGRPWIDAGIGQLNGQVRAFAPNEGACYECSFTPEDYVQVIVPCNRLASIYTSQGKIPTTPTIASIVAGVQVQEALKFLDYERWRDRTLSGREFIFNGTVGDVSIAMLPVREDCPAHDFIDSAEILELHEATASKTTVEELMRMIQTHLGAGASLELNFELAIGLDCENCQHHKELLKPIEKLFREDLNCPNCEKECKPMLTHVLNEVLPFYDGLRHLPLSAINIPALDILEGIGADGTCMFFELTGDSEKYFG